jgi:hypothetical protein
MNDCQVAQSKREKEKAVRANMCTHLADRAGKQPAEHRFESNCTLYISLYMGAARNPKHAIFHCAALFEMCILYAARNIVRSHAISICSTSCLIRRCRKKNWNFACVEIKEKLLLSRAISE